MSPDGCELGWKLTRRSYLWQTASLWAGGLLFSGKAPLAVAADTGLATRFSRMRIVGYNVHNYRLKNLIDPITERGSPAKPEAERAAMATILARLKPDILGLSEMGDEESLMDLQDRLEAAGHTMPFREILLASDPARHLALLSRVPVVARQHVTKPTFLMDKVERVMARGIFDVTLDAGNGLLLRLLGAHLKSRRDMMDADQALVRRNEAHVLRKHVDSILAVQPDVPLVLFGDFNDTRDSPSLREIMQPEDPTHKLPLVPLEDSAGNRWTYHYEPADEYSRIDFLFTSPAVVQMIDADESGVYAGKDWRQASDHRPIYVTLRPGRAKRAQE